jgi:hypothetical protein
MLATDPPEKAAAIFNARRAGIVHDQRMQVVQVLADQKCRQRMPRKQTLAGQSRIRLARAFRS